MDVVLKRTTEVGESTREYISGVDFGDDGNDATLSQIEGRDNFDKVDVRCKVVRVKEANGVNGGKTKQDVLVGDHTGIGCVILWEEHIGSMREDVLSTLWIPCP